MTRLQTILANLDAQYGAERLREAKSELLASEPSGSIAIATEATNLLPNDAYGWRIRGWLELRKDSPIAAAESFRRAIAAAKDKAAERARAEALLRMFSQDVSVLDEKDAPVPP